MTRWLLLPLLAVVVSAVSRDRRIVGGNDVEIEDFPWQGSYRTGTGSHTCGCVFVGAKWVLTAGHCGGSSSYSMEFGATNRGNNQGVIVGVSDVLRHPEYNQGPGFTPNDISVVTASEEIEGDNIAPGSLPPDADNPRTFGWITGWGRTCGGCSLPTTLQGVETAIIDDVECAELMGTSFQADNMICVYNAVSQDSGACNGDSGGPLSVESTIYGLTSWGRSGCLTNYASVYNRLGAFVDWVCENTEGAPDGCDN